MPIHLLDNASPVSAYKEYTRSGTGILKDGDKIQVKITVNAKQATQFSYLDEIKGPWEIPQNDDGTISTWNKGTLPATASIDWTISNGYAYMVDNISLQANQSVSF